MVYFIGVADPRDDDFLCKMLVDSIFDRPAHPLNQQRLLSAPGAARAIEISYSKGHAVSLSDTTVTGVGQWIASLGSSYLSPASFPGE